jgi:membrane protein DedA with SNARE-associated domain
LIYTAIGAGLWNSFLAYVGMRLGSNWGVIRGYSEVIDIILVVIIVVAVIYLIWKNWPKKNKVIS